jgi:DNA modification methylase
MLNKHLISRLERIDWDFAGTASDSPFSPLHWHPARLPAQVASTFIGLLSDPGELVLDPFLGSGTTAIEAQRLGRTALGFDLNPISCLISKAKTLPIRAATVAAITLRLKEAAKEALGTSLLSAASHPQRPESVQEKKWYTSRVLLDLSRLWSCVSSLRGFHKLMAQMAFSAILLPVSRETRHWGYVCDNSTPIDKHEGDVLTEFCRVLDRMVLAYRQRDESAQNLGVKSISRARITCIDSRVGVQRLKKASVKLVITSPPYFGVSDYVKSQRLSMEWFGLEIEPLRLLEIGARSKRHRQTALQDYLAEMRSVFSAMHQAISKDGACVIVLGESSKRDPYINQFNQALRECGYTIAYKTTRNISSQRRQYAHIETETITIVTPR